MGKKNIKTAECAHHSAVIATSHSLQVKPKPGSPRTSSCLHAHFGSEWFPFGWPLNSDNLMIHSVANVRSSPLVLFLATRLLRGTTPKSTYRVHLPTPYVQIVNIWFPFCLLNEVWLLGRWAVTVAIVGVRRVTWKVPLGVHDRVWGQVWTGTNTCDVLGGRCRK